MAPPGRALPVGSDEGVLTQRLESPWALPFDMAFGVLAPVLVLHLDLTLDMLEGPPEVLPLRPYSSLTAYACMAALAAWYPFRARPGRWQAAAAGPLLCGAVLAGSVGVMLLPLSLLGTLVMGIGFLGLVPLLTAVVFARTAVRAWARAPESLPLGRAAGLLLLSAALFGGLCLAGGRGIRNLELHSAEVIAGERPGDAASAERTLGFLRVVPGVSLTDLRSRAWGSPTGPGGTRCRKAYERITGRPLDFGGD